MCDLHKNLNKNRTIFVLKMTSWRTVKHCMKEVFHFSNVINRTYASTAFLRVTACIYMFALKGKHTIKSESFIWYFKQYKVVFLMEWITERMNLSINRYRDLSIWKTVWCTYKKYIICDKEIYSVMKNGIQRLLLITEINFIF
jgi:hypothetical protein